MLAFLQDLPALPMPSKPDDTVAGWMLWVMAGAVVVMGYAVYRMFLKFTEDKAALVLEVQKAKVDAEVRLEAARQHITTLNQDIATLNRSLGIAEAKLEMMGKK